jgi:hypothetical protein
MSVHILKAVCSNEFVDDGFVLIRNLEGKIATAIEYRKAIQKTFSRYNPYLNLVIEFDDFDDTQLWDVTELAKLLLYNRDNMLSPAHLDIAFKNYDINDMEIMLENIDNALVFEGHGFNTGIDSGVPRFTNVLRTRVVVDTGTVTWRLFSKNEYEFWTVLPPL